MELSVPLQASTTARSQCLLKTIGQTNAPVSLPLGMIYFRLFVFSTLLVFESYL